MMAQKITNAFYVVKEKKNQGLSAFEPTFTLKNPPSDSRAEQREETKFGAVGMMMSVKDNGNGIPQKILNKIIQPFFTTKPTGEGTGLGLSLSYHIVKAHGGEMKIETTEGEYTAFSIIIPSNPILV